VPFSIRCPRKKTVIRVARFFTFLILRLSRDFVVLTDCFDSGKEDKTIWQVRDEYLAVLPSTFIRIEEELIEPRRKTVQGGRLKNKALDKKEDASEGSDSEIDRGFIRGER
jgi:hypothetical protein